MGILFTCKSGNLQIIFPETVTLAPYSLYILPNVIVYYRVSIK